MDKSIEDYVDLYLQDKIDICDVTERLTPEEFEQFIDEVERSGG